MRELIIGTRGSKLALVQAENIKSRLENFGIKVELKIIKTSGDLNQKSFNEIPLKKLFVKEIEEELLEGKIDLAVHSMKDMPYEEVEGLIMGAFPEREDPRDALVSDKKEFRIIGTGSERRRVQIEEIYKDAEIKAIRGNVDTRIGKADSGEYDGVILAAAGLKRLGLEGRISRYFEVHELVPSPCQGVLGLQCRANDSFVKELLDKIDNKTLRKIVDLERLFGKIHNGGCKSPIGAYAEINGETAKILVMKYTDKVVKQEITGNINDMDYFEREYKKI